MQVICSGQAPASVASCGDGKQRRTKTRKEETEKAENLIAKRLGNPRRASSVSPRTRHGNHSVAGYVALTFERIQAPRPLPSAKAGFFDFGLLIRRFNQISADLCPSMAHANLLWQWCGQVSQQKAHNWCSWREISIRETMHFSAGQLNLME